MPKEFRMKWLFIFLFASALSATEISNDFYKNVLSGKTSKHSDDQCYPQPDRGSCVKEFCSRLPNWECDSADEIQRATKACSGNFGNACLSKACNKLPTFERDDFNELSEIAMACKNVYGSGCFDFIASKVPTYQVDDRAEVVNVINHCKSVSPEVLECAQYTCSRLASYACDEVQEITNVLKDCGR